MYTFTPTKLSGMQMLEPELLLLSYKATMSYTAEGSSPQKELQLRYQKSKPN